MICGCMLKSTNLKRKKWGSRSIFIYTKTEYHLLVVDKSSCSDLSNPSAMDCKIKLTFSLLVIRLTPRFENTIMFKTVKCISHHCDKYCLADSLTFYLKINLEGIFLLVHRGYITRPLFQSQ